jgi:hypothetical protein
MAVIQVNPPGMTSTTEGYISSITVYTGGSAQALTPNGTTGQVTVSAAAATNIMANNRVDQAPKLVTG